jgi:cell division protein FtsL
MNIISPEKTRDRLRRGADKEKRRSPRTPDRSGSSSKTRWRRHGTALPGWSDLDTEPAKQQPDAGGRFLERVSTVRFALLILVLAGAFTLYIGHVHATQSLLANLQEARTANRQLHLKHNRLKGEYDRKTGPAVIQRRARQLGLEEAVAFGPPVRVAPSD